MQKAIAHVLFFIAGFFVGRLLLGIIGVVLPLLPTAVICVFLVLMYELYRQRRTP